MKKDTDISVERYEVVNEAADGMRKQPQAMGTVTITDNEDVFLIPKPSSDPRGPSIFDGGARPSY